MSAKANNTMTGCLGDGKTMIVHHLDNMQKKCDIYHVEKSQKQYFTPDLLKTALDLGFSQCTWRN